MKRSHGRAYAVSEGKVDKVGKHPGLPKPSNSFTWAWLIGSMTHELSPIVLSFSLKTIFTIFLSVVFGIAIELSQNQHC